MHPLVLTTLLCEKKRHPEDHMNSSTVLPEELFFNGLIWIQDISHKRLFAQVFYHKFWNVRTILSGHFAQQF